MSETEKLKAILKLLPENPSTIFIDVDLVKLVNEIKQIIKGD